MKSLALALLLLALASPALAAEFGYHPGTPGGVSGAQAGDAATASRYVLSENGTVTAITAWIRAAGDILCKAMIYSNGSGVPSALLQVSDPANVAFSAGGSYVTFTGGTLGSLSSGTYWLAYVCNTVNDQGWDSIGGGVEEYAGANSYTSPVDPWVAGTSFPDFQIAIYATYTPTGGGPSATSSKARLKGR